LNNKLEIAIRKLEIKDLEAYQYWNHPNREHHKFNGPYYGVMSETELQNMIETLRSRLSNNEENIFPNKEVIVNAETDELIGTVNWYWKSEETQWMEVGLVIFNENYWGKGIGASVLKMWIDKVFASNPEIVRLGLSTWSGNVRMMKLAEKLGLIKEAVYRKARIVDGQYYDSVSFGTLREEWELMK
jgi:putative hydrolase of HD superfamily